MRIRPAVVTAVILAAAALGTAGPAAAQSPAEVRSTLAFQYQLANDVPLANTPWVYTHNSYNSFIEMGANGVSGDDPNQDISIAAQLDAGVRSLEIDEHLYPNPADPRVDGKGPVVCHAFDSNRHVPCTANRTLASVLAGVRRWLRAHPRQVLLLYLESHLDSAAGYDAGAADVRRTLGDVLWRPRGGGATCSPLPLRLTRNRVLAAGKQVIAMGPCGAGTQWQGLVHDESLRITGPDNSLFTPYPACGPDFTRAQYDAQPIRYYEDGTRIGAAIKTTHTAISPALVAQMTRCGVDLIGLDHLQRNDPRLAGYVWSWAPGQPGREGCAVQRADSRWATRGCWQERRVACRSDTGAWKVPRTEVPVWLARRVCARRGLTFAVPRTGYENALLRTAATQAGAGSVWLAERRTRTGWRALDRRG